MIVELIDYKKKRAVDCDITEVGDKLYFRFPYNEYIKDSIKGCEGSQFDWDDKVWSIKHHKLSQRNANILGWLSKGKIGNPSAFDNLLIKVERFTDYPSHLYDHQKDALDHIRTRRRFCVAHDMGLGKSLTCITFLDNLLNFIPDVPEEVVKAIKNGNTLQYFWIIAPKAPLRAWYYEMNKWKCKVNPQFLTCDQSKIKTAIVEANIPPYVLIIDECSRFRNATAKRSFYLKQLIDKMMAYWGDPIIIELSGTPTPKDPTNWHNIIELICPGYLTERDAKQLLSTVAELKQETKDDGVKFNKISSWKLDKVKELYHRIAPLVHVRTKEQCLDLPPKIYEEVNLQYSDYALGLARTVVDTAPRAVTALMKLRQLSDGFMYNDIDDNGEATSERVITFDTPKDEALTDILDSIKAEDETRVVVWAGFTASVDKCVNLCLQNGWNVIRVDGRGWSFFHSPVYMDERTNGRYAQLSKIEQEFEHRKIGFSASQAQFQDYNLDIPIAFVGNADAGGQGLTLTAAKLAVYYSNSFSAENRIQSEDRIYRIGSRGAIIKDLIHLPTDRLILNNLRTKRDLMALSMGQIIDEIKFLERQVIEGKI